MGFEVGGRSLLVAVDQREVEGGNILADSGAGHSAFGEGTSLVLVTEGGSHL